MQFALNDAQCLITVFVPAYFRTQRKMQWEVKVTNFMEEYSCLLLPTFISSSKAIHTVWKTAKSKLLKKKKKMFAEWSGYTACYHVISRQEEGEIVIQVIKPKKVTQNNPKAQDSERACNLSAWWHKAMSNEWDQRTKFPQLQIILWHFCWRFSTSILVCVLFWSPLETGIRDR